MDAVFTPGFSAAIGSPVDVYVGKEINVNWIGNGKSWRDVGIDFSTSCTFDKIGDISYKSLSPFLKSNFEKSLYNSITTMPSKIAGVGMNVGIKKKIEENEKK